MNPLYGTAHAVSRLAEGDGVIRRHLPDLGIDLPRHPLGGRDDPAVPDDGGTVSGRRWCPARAVADARAGLVLADGEAVAGSVRRGGAVVRRLSWAAGTRGAARPLRSCSAGPGGG